MHKSERNNKRWSDSELEYINENYRELSVGPIAKKLGRSEKATRTQIERMGIKLSNLKRYGWSDSEEQLIKKHIDDDKEHLARLFPDRKWPEVYSKARRMGRKYDPYSREIINGYGYKLVRIDGKYQPEHRRVVENNIGRKLKRDEIVHNIDFNKQNNEFGNLHVFENTSEHIKCHMGASKLLSELLEKGIIKFNTSTGEYEICKNQ